MKDNSNNILYENFLSNQSASNIEVLNVKVDNVNSHIIDWLTFFFVKSKIKAHPEEFILIQFASLTNNK